MGDRGGREGVCSRGRGEKNGGEKGGRGGMVVLYQRAEVGDGRQGGATW
jgi:hypothetical protein